jgi:hypothetical protein
LLLEALLLWAEEADFDWALLCGVAERAGEALAEFIESAASTRATNAVRHIGGVRKIQSIFILGGFGPVSEYLGRCGDV